MEKIKKEKINRFLADKMMSDTVFSVLNDVFTRPNNIKKDKQDVYLLAAERIAANLLLEAWSELKKLSDLTQEKEKKGGNIGL